MKKKMFVVSDIHGCASLLKLSLKSAGFEIANNDHLLVCLGDCFDRGYENIAVYEYLKSIPNKILVKGNHEDLIEMVIHDHTITDIDLHNGTDITIREFFGENRVKRDGKILKTKKAENSILEFTGGMRDYFETESYVFVHGWIPVKELYDMGERSFFRYTFNPDWRNAGEQEWRDARFLPWYEMYRRKLKCSGKTIVCGHSPVLVASYFDENRDMNDTTPYYGDGFIAIDACSYRTGKLNVLILEDEISEE